MIPNRQTSSNHGTIKGGKPLNKFKLYNKEIVTGKQQQHPALPFKLTFQLQLEEAEEERITEEVVELEDLELPMVLLEEEVQQSLK